MQLQGNKILITGATAGIGEAMLRKFLSLDNHIIAVGRNEQKLQQLAHLNERIIPFACDISNGEDLNKLILFLKDNHQDTNILINNAGIQYNYNFEEEALLAGKIEHEVNVNFLAPLKLIAGMLPLLSRNDNSAIVNVSSGLALVPKMQAPVYCGTKAAIHIFSRSLRYQLKRTKVFEVIPPLVDTQMTRGRGSGKISPERLVEEFIKDFKNNKYEVNIGKVKLLKFLNRWLPSIAAGIMKKGGE